MPLGRSPPLSSLNQSLYRQPHLTGRLIVFQCPFFFAIFALVNASEIELLLARACAASNSFSVVVLLFGPRVVPASLRFFLTPAVPTSLRFFFFGPRVVPASLRLFLTPAVPASLRFFLFGPRGPRAMPASLRFFVFGPPIALAHTSL
jgi:hypothetical protein